MHSFTCKNCYLIVDCITLFSVYILKKDVVLAEFVHKWLNASPLHTSCLTIKLGEFSE